MTKTELGAIALVHAWRILLVLVGSFLLLGLPEHPRAAGPSAVSEAKADLKTVTIPVEGMSCVACAASIKKALKSIDGVSNVEVSLEKRTAQVTYAPDRLSPEHFVATINKLGYKAGVPAAAQ